MTYMSRLFSLIRYKLRLLTTILHFNSFLNHFNFSNLLNYSNIISIWKIIGKYATFVKTHLKYIKVV